MSGYLNVYAIIVGILCLCAVALVVIGMVIDARRSRAELKEWDETLRQIRRSHGIND